MHRTPDICERPLLIGGMHRSGTSLTASLFASAGLDLGPALLGGNESNPLGHFEDLGFQDLHARALVSQGLCGEGYTASHRGTLPTALEREARDLLAARMRPGTAWGWKEPRTTLFLDYWRERLPHAGHVFVFRRPWEVADSLFRRGDPTFVMNPVFAFDVWTHYNRLVLDFARRHPASTMVFDIAQVIEDPHRVFAAVRSQFDVPLGRPGPLFRDECFTTGHDPRRVALVRDAAPEAWQTYHELRKLAHAGDAFDADPAQPVSAVECAVLEWAWASRAEADGRRRAEAEARQREERRRAREARAFWRFGAIGSALRHARGALLDGMITASRHLASTTGPEPAGPPPVLLPFPAAGEQPAVRRAA